MDNRTKLEDEIKTAEQHETLKQMLLRLLEDWAKDQTRRHKAKVPEASVFQTKPEIALEQIKAARTAGLPQGVVLIVRSNAADRSRPGSSTTQAFPKRGGTRSG